MAAEKLAVTQANKAASVEDLDHTDLQRAFGEDAVRVGAGVRVTDGEAVVGYFIDGRVVHENTVVYLGLDDPNTPSDQPDGDETVHALIDVPDHSSAWSLMNEDQDVTGSNRWEQHRLALEEFSDYPDVTVSSTHPEDEDPVASAEEVENRVEDLLRQIATEVDERLAALEKTKANARAGIQRALGNRVLRRAGVILQAAPAEAADTAEANTTAQVHEDDPAATQAGSPAPAAPAGDALTVRGPGQFTL